MFLYSVCIFIMGMIFQQILMIFDLSHGAVALILKGIVIIASYLALSVCLLNKQNNPVVRFLSEKDYDIFFLILICPIAIMYYYYHDTLDRIKNINKRVD